MTNLTQSAVASQLRAVGITLKKVDDEFQVTPRGAKGDATTYFTDDLEDAYGTGLAMAREAEKRSREKRTDAAATIAAIIEAHPGVALRVVRSLDEGEHHEITLQASTEAVALHAIVSACKALSPRGDVSVGARLSAIQAREFVGSWIISDKRGLRAERTTLKLGGAMMAVPMQEKDRNYCKHGTYVGDQYGPDYLCGACESE